MTALLLITVLAASPKPLEVSTVRDASITAAATVVWFGTELLKKELAPANCRWCDRAADGTDTLNAVDTWGRGARWSNPSAANTWSNVVDYAVLPLGMVSLDYALAHGSGDTGAMGDDMLIVAESVALSQATDQIVKFAVGRERPFVHVLPPEQKPLTENPDDNNLSFFSGHTSFAFSLVAAMGTVAELRDYPHKELVWLIGVPIACFVPYLRMAADKHYLTDVLAGAVVGTAFGVGVPLLLHPRSAPLPAGLSAGVAPVPAGAVATLSGTF